MRNLAVTCWYDQYPEFSHLLFVDSDMGFPCEPDYGKPNLIRDMIKFNKPVTGCFYAKRKADAEIVGTAEAHTIDDVQHGFLKVTGMGCGVMMISRDVITTMLEKIPHICDRVTSLLARARPDAKITRIIGAFSKLQTDERMLNEARINNALLAALGRGDDLETATGEERLSLQGRLIPIKSGGHTTMRCRLNASGLISVRAATGGFFIFAGTRPSFTNRLGRMGRLHARCGRGL
jgi:hypothetical protein